ncbi:GLPGLI family protein [Sphingobacterium sp. MYb382]|uniref:GLPGLI family protein n=1 Tax=Sphingobacterium sp. MYb382 TaxID=2745278 RepID=UPI0030984356
MKKKLYRLFILLFWSVGVQGQAIKSTIHENPVYRVYYEHHHVRDENNKDEVYKELMLLKVGTEHAQFISYDKVLSKAVLQKQVVQEFDMGKEQVNITRGKVVIPDEIIISYNTNQALVDAYISRHYVYPEILSPIDWQLVDSIRTIAGIPCSFATAQYAGRDWKVWFSLEHAIPAGPWFLRGLPGLIVEAVDNRGEVKYLFSRLEPAETKNEVLDYLPQYKPIQLSATESSVVTDKADFEKKAYLAKTNPNLFKKEIDNPLMYSLGGGFDLGVSNDKSWNVVIPNPIALSKL